MFHFEHHGVCWGTEAILSWGRFILIGSVHPVWTSLVDESILSRPQEVYQLAISYSWGLICASCILLISLNFQIKPWSLKSKLELFQIRVWTFVWSGHLCTSPSLTWGGTRLARLKYSAMSGVGLLNGPDESISWVLIQHFSVCCLISQEGFLAWYLVSGVICKFWYTP